MLADSASPHGLSVPILGGYIVPRASHRVVASSACLGRKRLMEQPVSSDHYSCKTETQATYRSHKHLLRDIQSNSCNLHNRSSCSVTECHTHSQSGTTMP